MDGEEGDQSPSLPTGVRVKLYNCCYEIDVSEYIASIDVLIFHERYFHVCLLISKMFYTV